MDPEAEWVQRARRSAFQERIHPLPRRPHSCQMAKRKVEELTDRQVNEREAAGSQWSASGAVGVH